MNVKRAFERVPVDREAEERAWTVVRAAFAEREPVHVVRRRWPVAVVALAAVCLAAALSPPGRAVVNAVRRSIGITHASPALFRLPAPGRLLVSGGGGTWVVTADGSKRRLGDWTSASWSPHGLFVVTADRDSLAAVEPRAGVVHWSLSRPAVALPRWGGTRLDTRIAYLSGSSLRVVAGDGTGDRLVAAHAARIAPVWEGSRHVLAYATAGGAVVVRDTDTGKVLSRRHVGDARALAWSRDGRLAIATSRGVDGLRLRGVRAIAFAPNGDLAIVTAHALLVSGPEGVQTVLRVAGRLAGVAWSPDGRWLVTSLPGADQWVFVGRRGRVLGVAHIARQFGGGEPELDGWVPDA